MEYPHLPIHNGEEENGHLLNAASTISDLNILMPYGTQHPQPSYGDTNEDSKSEKKKQRAACHRCGNMRKGVLGCTEWYIPQVFCKVCQDLMATDHGENVFSGGCPKCKMICCCAKKTIECTAHHHCYRKCPASKSTQTKKDKPEKFSNSESLLSPSNEHSSTHYSSSNLLIPLPSISQSNSMDNNFNINIENASATELLGANYHEIMNSKEESHIHTNPSEILTSLMQINTFTSIPAHHSPAKYNVPKIVQQQQMMTDAGYDDVDEDKTLYCSCKRVSFGEMVGCDGEGCDVEWFHLECVNLTKAPIEKWYCSKCTNKRKNEGIRSF